MFKDRTSLQAVLPDLSTHAILNFSAEDVLRFLGRKLHPNFKGQVTSDHKRRPEGVRVKHRVKRNSIKFYDKDSVLRIETTINNPSEFKVLKTVETHNGPSLRWVPMRKGVANAHRMLQVATQSNLRYLEALCDVEPKREASDTLHDLGRPHQKEGRQVARFNRGTGTLDGWRLPNINELESLVDCDHHSPALPAPHPFRRVGEEYWSSTTSVFEPDWAWALYLAKGAIGVGQKGAGTSASGPSRMRRLCLREPEGCLRGLPTIPRRVGSSLT